MKKLLLKISLVSFTLIFVACSAPATNETLDSVDTESVESSTKTEVKVNFLEKYNCKILKEEKFKNIKKSIYIQIPKQLTEEQIKEIAQQIKRDNVNFERLFILYLLPDMKIGRGAWATSHYNPTLEINIMGVDQATEEKLKNVDTVEGELVGKWYDNSPYGEHTVVIYKANGQFKMIEKFKDGRERKKDLKASKHNGKQKFTYDNDYGDYLIIEMDGSLGSYDRDGFISASKKIE